MPSIITDAVIEALRQAGPALAIVDGSGALVHQDGRMRRLSRLGNGSRMPEELLARLLEDGEATTDAKFAVARPDARSDQLRWSSWPVRDGEGGIVGAAMIAVQLAAQTDAGVRLAYFDELLKGSDDAIVGTDADFRVTIWSAGAEKLYGYTADEARGRMARELASYGGDPSRTRLEAELSERGRTRTELTAMRPDGQAVEVEMTIVAVSDDGGEVVGYLGIHRDVSAHKRAEAEREAAARQQGVVATLGLKALTGEFAIESLLEEAVELVARTLDVKYVSVGELVDDNEVVRRAGTGWPHETIGTTSSPAARESFAGYTLIAAEPVVSDDVGSDPRFTPPPMLDTSRRTSGAGVVIHGRDEPFGLLKVFSEDALPFTREALSFLESVASVLGFAIQRSRSEHRVEEVRQAERQRLARALHDEALGELAVAASRARGNPSVESALAAVTRRLRAAIYDLRLDDEEHRPLRDLVATLVEVHRDLADDAEIVLEIEDSAPTSSLGADGIEIVHILGEALTNARLHGGAQSVHVRVWGSAGTVFAEVSDDGSGTAAAPAAGGGRATGIIAMGERARLIDAELQIRSVPGEGTSVCLEVPLVDVAKERDGETRVLLVEDHVAVREAMAHAMSEEPGVVVAGQAGSLEEARRMLRDVDVAVLDLGLPDGFGADLIADLRSANPRCQALVLSAALDHGAIAQAVDRGAAGVLEKTAPLQEVVAAVKKLRAGQTLLPPSEVRELLKFAREEQERERLARLGADALTSREREVLQLLANGLNTQQISERLHISTRTHRNHVAGILRKLGVHSQLQAVLLALRLDLVELDR
ncbi:MAG TPA: PAS domain S-box protein [Thermoleophilaceae bacterium]|nr:PAS domain S-box protein [Thermoleophilaceae bacterium]